MPTADEGTSVARSQTAPDPDDPRKPDSPDELRKPSWKYLVKRAFQEFSRDQCTDIAAALTYYAVLALFPGLLALMSVVGVFGHGQQTVDTIKEMGSSFMPPGTMEQIEPIVQGMVSNQAAGLTLIVGLLGALWSASVYINAFSRAMNRMYEVDEGRPAWKLRPTMLALTLVIIILIAFVLMGLVVSGPIAQAIGDQVGMGDTAMTVWGILKWPTMLAMVIIIVALLYYVTPNIQQPKFHWLSIGAVIAIGTWIVASAVFGIYVANFGNYNKIYGALAGVIVMLLWLWITNLALLFGAEFDAEMERARQLQAGIKAEETLQLPPRDTKASEKKAEKREESIEKGRQIRLQAEAAGVMPPEQADQEGTENADDAKR